MKPWKPLTVALVFAMPAFAQEVDLEALERKLKAEQARETQAQQADAARQAAQARQGQLVLRSDVDCALSIDGEPRAQLIAQQIQTVPVAPGQQIVECVAAGPSGERYSAIHEVAASAKSVVDIRLAADVETVDLARARAANSAPTSAKTADPAGEGPLYDSAFDALKEGRYAEAARRFQAFLASYPNGSDAPNALYWLGESYYMTQNYQIALDAFLQLLATFPDSHKTPDALLKVGYCHYELRQWKEAESSLNEVVRRYPGSAVSRLAEGRLRAMALEIGS